MSDTAGRHGSVECDKCDAPAIVSEDGFTLCGACWEERENAQRAQRKRTHPRRRRRWEPRRKGRSRD